MSRLGLVLSKSRLGLEDFGRDSSSALHNQEFGTGTTVDDGEGLEPKNFYFWLT